MISFYKEFLMNQELDSREKLILIQLVTLKVCQVNVTLSAIGKTLGMSSKTMTKVFRSFEERGIISVERDYSKFSFGTPLYLITIPVSPQVTEHIKQKTNTVLPGHILDYLSEVTGQGYIMTDKVRDTIQSRIDEGFSIDDFKKVVDTCNNAWVGTSFEERLNPCYLFNENFYKRLRY